jgi:hypothetical protein
MKIGAAFAADLGILTVTLDEPGADVLQGADAQLTVPTYLGLSATVDASHPPLTFNTIEHSTADEVRISLGPTPPRVGVSS